MLNWNIEENFHEITIKIEIWKWFRKYLRSNWWLEKMWIKCELLGKLSTLFKIKFPSISDSFRFRNFKRIFGNWILWKHKSFLFSVLEWKERGNFWEIWSPIGIGIRPENYLLGTDPSSDQRRSLKGQKSNKGTSI